MIPIVMSEMMNQKKTTSHSKIKKLEDYDKVLPVVEVYPCVQSERPAAHTDASLVKEVGVTHGIHQFIRIKEHLHSMTLFECMMIILISKK